MVTKRDVLSKNAPVTRWLFGVWAVRPIFRDDLLFICQGGRDCENVLHLLYVMLRVFVEICGVELRAELGRIGKSERLDSIPLRRIKELEPGLAGRAANDQRLPVVGICYT